MSVPSGITGEHDSIDTGNFTEEKKDMEGDELRERIHALETGAATQAATTIGMEATNAATTVGMQATLAAAQVGTWAVMVAGSVGMVVGIILGFTIAKTKG